MDDPRLGDVEHYHGRLRSELDVIARGPVLVGPKIIEHINSLITLIDLHQPNEFDLCLSCDRLWPCSSIVAITGVSPDEPGLADEAEPADLEIPGDVLNHAQLGELPAPIPPVGRILPPASAGAPAPMPSVPMTPAALAPVPAVPATTAPAPAMRTPAAAGPAVPAMAALAPSAGGGLPREDRSHDPAGYAPSGYEAGQRDRGHGPRPGPDSPRPTAGRPEQGRLADGPRHGEAARHAYDPRYSGPPHHRPEPRPGEIHRYEDMPGPAGAPRQGGGPPRYRDEPRRDQAPRHGQEPRHGGEPRYGSEPRYGDELHYDNEPSYRGERAAVDRRLGEPRREGAHDLRETLGSHASRSPRAAGPEQHRPEQHRPDQRGEQYAAGPPLPAGGRPGPLPAAPFDADIPFPPAPVRQQPPGQPRPTGAVPRLPGIAAPGMTPAPPDPAPTPAQAPTARRDGRHYAAPTGAHTGAPRQERPPHLPGLAPPAPGERTSQVPGQPEDARPARRTAPAGVPGGPARRPDDRIEGMPTSARPADQAALPRYPDGIAVPASRPAPPISGPVEIAGRAELAAARAGDGPPPRQLGESRPSAGWQAGEAGFLAAPDGSTPAAGRPAPTGGFGRDHLAGGTGGSRGPDGSRGVGGPGPTGGADRGLRGQGSGGQGSGGFAVDGRASGPPPVDRLGLPRHPQSEAGRTGRGPIGAGPTGLPHSRHGADHRSARAAHHPPGRAASTSADDRAPSAFRGPAASPDGTGPDAPAGPAAQTGRGGLTAAAAQIDQAQVDEVTRAWLARRESVLDGIDVI
ncbi:hypothetical protein [Frankia sp. AiPa1]|uniref:hypothetical protein n=1 Tax=Frankia sp. AiPa1 TaxID=573492 RepID=UPI00202AE41A|nr:hypothetical protein [Frankia sp. AiPa1]MCL9762402.1 hypothetical protein [Frankia sp. AiPa1]